MSFLLNLYFLEMRIGNLCFLYVFWQETSTLYFLYMFIGKPLFLVVFESETSIILSAFDKDTLDKKTVQNTKQGTT